MSTAVLSYFQNKHKEILGMPYAPTWGKDNKLLKDIVSVYDMKTLSSMIDAFFGVLLTDPFLQRAGASIGTFKSQIPKLIMKISQQATKQESGKL